MSQFADEIQSEMLAEKDDEITSLRADLTKAEHIIAAYELVSVQRGADLSAAITRANHAEAALVAVTAERDRMRELVKRYEDGYDEGYDEGLAKSENKLTRLRAALVAVIEERDRMREVIKGINAMLQISCETLERPTYDSLEVGQRHSPLSQKEIIQRFTETCSFVRADLLRTIDEARAAIEGVKEPASLWQHKKTGGIYEIVGECQIESTNTPGVLYRNTSTGVTWVRPKEEFFDGRFVEWRKPEPPR